jgi:putative redox protein
MSSEMKIQIRQVSATTSEATMGRHQVLVDRPTAKGGSDMGPMGGQLFLAGIGGCFMSTLLAAVRAGQAEISCIRTEVTGIVSDTPARFTSVELYVVADSARQDQLERLVEIADQTCIMMNTLRGKLDIRVRIGAPV